MLGAEVKKKKEGEKGIHFSRKEKGHGRGQASLIFLLRKKE